MARSIFLASALALQAITGAYAASQTRLNARAVRPGEPPVFEAKPFPSGNGTNETYIPPHVDSPHFRLFLGPTGEAGAAEAGAAEALKPLEAAYDCFVGALGWNSTGLSVRDTREPYWKTEMFMRAQLDGGVNGLTHYGVDTGRAWVQLMDGQLTQPELLVHEYGHVLHFHQGNFWGSMVNAQAWAEAVANWVADTYLTSDLCAESRAKLGQPVGQSVINIYRTVGDSHLTIVDATNTQVGNHYDAWPFFHYLVANPDSWHGLGSHAMLSLIGNTTEGSNETPLHSLQRVLGDTATVSEVVAKYWARMAYVDIAHPQALQAFLDNKAFLNQANLDKLAEGQYKVKDGRSPRYMGASMAPLVMSGTGSGAAKVAVNITAPGGHLVATLSVRDTASGRIRYVTLPGGAGSADIAAGEEATLVLVNAPEALLMYDGNKLAGSEANKGLDYYFTITGATVSMY
ncbi:hypothetical protein C8A00DRAFT_34876 [Chaetomidium leptoderma]|uniref:Dockerin type 1 n=1 Tax=Chaetomidium leptoderma TaxID=669021 RepID=A0AAN6VL93_9PEZI|nr:hypothetical protein C8A00DRAFT_34876 [Chaetomidium leptoderma]